jgi:hypothetical protein
VPTILENDFEVLYKNNSTSSYLILKANNYKTVINYQVQMLLNNRPNALLKFNANYIENNLNCYYDITSKCTLSGFLSRKRFSRDEFLKTILSIINNIYQLKSYLLYDSNILLDENFIYVEPEKAEIYFVYFPFSGCENNFRAFFTQLIFKLIKFQDEFSDNYIQKILEIIKDENFNIADLKLLAEKLMGEAIKNQILQPCAGLSKSMDMRVPEDMVVNRLNKHGKELNRTEQVKPNKANETAFRLNNSKKVKADISRVNIKIPDGETDCKQKNQKVACNISKAESSGNSSNTVKKNRRVLPVILLIQLFIITTFIYTFSSGLADMSDDPAKTKAILIFIFVCIDILAIRLVLEKKKTQCDDTCGVLQKISAAMYRRTIKPAETEEADNTIKSEERKFTFQDVTCNGATELIKIPVIKETPCLKEKDGEKIIKISKNDILIGRMKSFVDFGIENNAIGKIHAEILEEEREFYVIDCNSKNGTFINDTRIAPNTRHKLKNNDTLRFANVEYIFCSKSEEHANSNSTDDICQLI